MTLYRKKPIVVEARQVTEHSWGEVMAWCDGQAMSVVGSGVFVVCTLEGSMLARIGDWVIKGVEGEFYPCADSVFRATYEPVGSEAETGARSVTAPEDFHAVLKWFSTHEATEYLSWSYRGGEPTWWLDCSDFFDLACADTEEITAADLPALTQAYDDLHSAAPGECYEVYSCELFICRKRGERPCEAWLRKEIRDKPIRALFEAAGPWNSRWGWLKKEAQ